MSESILKLAELQVERMHAALCETFAAETPANRLEMFKRWLTIQAENKVDLNTPEKDDPTKGVVAQFARFIGLEEPRWQAKEGYIADGNIIYLFSLKA